MKKSAKLTKAVLSEEGNRKMRLLQTCSESSLLRLSRAAENLQRCLHSSFLLSLFLLAIAVPQAEAASKTNQVKFSQSWAQKLVNDDGPTDSEEWRWSVSGILWGDFSKFGDETRVGLVIGDFNSTDYFETIGDIKAYIDGEGLNLQDPNEAKEKKMRGRYKIDTAKKTGSCTYNFYYSYDKERPNGDSVTFYKKAGSISFKWNSRGLAFNAKVAVSASDFYFKDAKAPEIPMEIEPLAPNPAPNPGKPCVVKQKGTAANICQVRFDNFVCSKRGFGLTVKKKWSRLIKKIDGAPEEFELNSHRLKEIKPWAILKVPDLPVAVADSADADYAAMLEIPVTSNDSNYIDSDVVDEADLLVRQISVQPKNGTAQISEDGLSIEYTPNDGFFGSDEFEYKAVDMMGRETNSAKVFVYVETPDVNRMPFAVDDVVENAPSSSSTVIDVLANDLDLDEGTLLGVSVSIPENGEAQIYMDPVDNKSKVLYTPMLGYVSPEDEPDTFEYSISDGQGGFSTASVFVYVLSFDKNTPPVAEPDSEITQINQSIDISVMNNDHDENGNGSSDPFWIAALIEDPKNGEIDTDGRTIIYLPNVNFSGQDSFKYKIGDANGGTAEATVTVLVNNPPVTFDDVALTEMNTPVVLTPLENDKDADGDALSLSLDPAIVPMNGTVVLNGKNLEYTPNDGFVGTDFFGYVANDPNNAGAGGIVTIFVGIPFGNNPPVAQDDNVIVVSEQDNELKILGNDMDADSDTLRFVEITQMPKYGRLIFSSTKLVYCIMPPLDGEDPEYEKKDTLKYVISDGKGGRSEATANLAINTAPYIFEDTLQTSADTPVEIFPVANDFDKDGDTIGVEAIGIPANGSAILVGDKITYTPNPGFLGVDSLMYTALDSRGASSTGFIFITVGEPSNP